MSSEDGSKKDGGSGGGDDDKKRAASPPPTSSVGVSGSDHDDGTATAAAPTAAAPTAATTTGNETAPQEQEQQQEQQHVLSAQEQEIINLMKQQALLEDIDRQTSSSSSLPTSSSDGGGGQTLSPQQLRELMLGARSGVDPAIQSHAFWDTQPMNHQQGTIMDDGTSADGSAVTSTERPEGPIQPDKTKDELRAEPFKMPPGFIWSDIDVTDETQRKELYDLLANNYVEDDDASFRFDYSQEFLLWALTPPGYRLDFLLGVRAAKSPHKLVAFISAVPTIVQVRSKPGVPMVEINFLCVHKKLRSKRLAPVLIKEITRRVNWTGTFQAVYTAGVVLPVPVSSARYHHRSLNPKKLVSVGFSRLPKKMTMARFIKHYKLPDVPHMGRGGDGGGGGGDNGRQWLRPMEPRDVPAVHKLLTTYLEKFQLKVLFTPEEVAHWLLPRPGVVNSYVVMTAPATTTKIGNNSNTKKKKESSAKASSTSETTADGDDGDDNKKNNAEEGEEATITDFMSFYHLPSKILKTPSNGQAATDDNNNYTNLFAAYSFYNVANTVPWKDLMRDALILAKAECRADVFNALNLMDNSKFLDDLKFGLGDGNLQYYLYNWACPALKSNQVGIVLL